MPSHEHTALAVDSARLLAEGWDRAQVAGGRGTPAGDRLDAEA